MFSIFLIVGIAIAVGIGLAMLATRHLPPGTPTLVPPEDDASEPEGGLQTVTPGHLEKLAETLCRENKVVIRDRLNNSPREIYWIAESNNDFFFGTYVLGFLLTDAANPYITMSDVLEFKDFLKSLGSGKGLLFTTGYFTRDVHQPLEGPKVTLYNKRKVLEELERLKLL